jgi:hypothetical protein
MFKSFQAQGQNGRSNFRDKPSGKTTLMHSTNQITGNKMTSEVKKG